MRYDGEEEEERDEADRGGDGEEEGGELTSADLSCTPYFLGSMEEIMNKHLYRGRVCMCNITSFYSRACNLNVR